jgi:hypothetical protein
LPRKEAFFACHDGGFSRCLDHKAPWESPRPATNARGGNRPVNRALKCDIGAFVVVWFVLMLHFGNAAYSYVAWDNVFLHCLGTVVVTALASALLAGMLWCLYYVFQSIVGGLGSQRNS